MHSNSNEKRGLKRKIYGPIFLLVSYITCPIKVLLGQNENPFGLMRLTIFCCFVKKKCSVNFSTRISFLTAAPLYLICLIKRFLRNSLHWKGSSQVKFQVIYYWVSKFFDFQLNPYYHIT